MQRIIDTFATLKATNKKALAIYLMAGDPDRATTLQSIHAIIRAGADFLELGFPFTDPMAEGIVIQKANERSLENKTTLEDVFAIVHQLREEGMTTPIILMGYANPVEQFGFQAFAQAAKNAGVDGLLLVDAPAEESSELTEVLLTAEIAPIFLTSITTPAPRAAQIAKAGRGFNYFVALNGVTGSSQLDLSTLSQHIKTVRHQISLPMLVGFGIKDPTIARQVAELAEGVVVGSRVVDEMTRWPKQDVPERLFSLVRDFRIALDAK